MAVVVLILKIVNGIILVNTSREIVFSTYENYGVLPSGYSQVVSDEIFEQIGFRNKTDKEINEICKIEKFFAAVGFTKSMVTYEYTYFPMDKETGESLGGSKEIPCILYYELIDGNWKIVDYYEAP